MTEPLAHYRTHTRIAYSMFTGALYYNRTTRTLTKPALAHSCVAKARPLAH